MTESLSNDNLEYISENTKRIKEEIAEAAVRSGRSPKDGKLLAVTKMVEPQKINYAIEK